MNRLTVKDDSIKEESYYLNPEFFPEGKQKAINKLGQLEDIEEELGIDLVTLLIGYGKTWALTREEFEKGGGLY